MARVEEVVKAIRNNPEQEIEINLLGGTVCGDDCQRKQWLKCDSERILAFEREKARRLFLKIGQPQATKTLFEIPV